MANMGPKRIDINPWCTWDYNLNGGTISRQVTTMALGGAHVQQGTAAIDDEIGWYVLLNAGTWQVNTIYRLNSDCGIATVKLDSTTLGTFDGYGFGTRDNVSTISSISVAATGIYTLKYVMASKNASATGYYYGLQWINLRQTA